MKHTVKIALGLALIMCIGLGSAKAQKFAYIDFQELMQLMPEFKTANLEMETYSKGLQDQLKSLNDELEKQYAEYQANESKWSQLIRDDREKGIRDLQSRIQRFQETASGDVRQKETDLLKPIIEKAKTNIASVAKEVGYTYVFDSSPGTPLLYKPEGDNIMAAVKKKLNITDAPAPVTPPANTTDKKPAATPAKK